MLVQQKLQKITVWEGYGQMVFFCVIFLILFVCEGIDEGFLQGFETQRLWKRFCASEIQVSCLERLFWLIKAGDWTIDFASYVI